MGDGGSVYGTDRGDEGWEYIGGLREFEAMLGGCLHLFWIII